MRILAHRGWWTTPGEKNARSAFERAFSAGYGIETDIRDCDGQLVVCHDLPAYTADRDLQMRFSDFLDLYTSFPARPMLALNVKSDGLAANLQAVLTDRRINEYFVFDMSVPDTLAYLHAGMPVFTRRSEFETGSVLDDRADGLWLDAFESSHVSGEAITSHVKAGTTVAIVSPELHKRPHLVAWHEWRECWLKLPKTDRDKTMLCTDHPDEAAAFFV